MRMRNSTTQSAIRNSELSTQNSGLMAAGGHRHRRGLMLSLMLIATFCWATNIIAGKEALRGFGALALAQMRVWGASVIYVALFLTWPRADYSRVFKWRSAPRLPSLRR